MFMRALASSDGLVFLAGSHCVRMKPALVDEPSDRSAVDWEMNAARAVCPTQSREIQVAC